MIEMVDLKSEYKLLSKQIETEISKVFSSGDYILGESVSIFEKSFAKYCGTKYAVATSSGTDALKLALLATGVSEVDEVITVSNSFIATSFAIHEIGATPIWIDIEPNSFNMDPEKIISAISEKTKAVLPVHLYGHCAKMDQILKIAREKGLLVIEDACQAHGSAYREKKAGSFGDAAAFSFYPSKNLGCYGDGGAVTTDNPIVYEKLIMLRNYGQSSKNQHDIFGYNCRLDSIQAAVLNVKLKHLEQWNQRRRKLASIYDELLSDNEYILTPPVAEASNSVYHQYVLQVPSDSRDNLMKHLKKHGISSAIHYPTPIHKQIVFKSFPHLPLPITEKLTSEILSLPIHPYLKDEDIQYVSKIINGYFQNEKSC